MAVSIRYKRLLNSQKVISHRCVESVTQKVESRSDLIQDTGTLTDT